MQPPAPARGALSPSPVRPPAARAAASLPDPRLTLRGMVGGENIAPARSSADSAIVRARWLAWEATFLSRFVILTYVGTKYVLPKLNSRISFRPLVLDSYLTDPYIQKQ
eukprot:3124115-Pleurochrysis_carterae.AAC.1